MVDCGLNAPANLGLQGTDPGKVPCGTIRVKLLKIGAQVWVTVREIGVSMASGLPYAEVLAQAWRNLQLVAPQRC